MRKLILLFFTGALMLSCSSYSEEEDEIINTLIMNELDTGIKIESIEESPKERFCYPFAIFKAIRDDNYLQVPEKKRAIYNRFREDSIAGYPGVEHGLSSKIVKYTLSNGEKKHTVVYFGRGGKVISATLTMYSLCH